MKVTEIDVRLADKVTLETQKFTTEILLKLKFKKADADLQVAQVDYNILVARIDAVKQVASRFGVVLVISHMKSVQEAFEQKIFFKPEDESVEVLVA